MALSTAAEIEALADKLTESADAMHAKVLSAAKSKTISQKEAQEAFDQLSSLRMDADSLYTDAIYKVLEDMESTQDELMGVIEGAKSKIEKIDRISDGLVLIANDLSPELIPIP
ncbi:hypothetical protein WH43_07375 [Rheinheimera sp. KL1]|uniref:hypothetical protein n=1 Tax=Rheinheimera sp. KL1 TaxID=1635005 RepID=UPI0006A9BA5C|nr:hypothetical protein [Rheinheimera sp. KL1]KOO58669.1 hypothetical protein WH43_07375 [Rheinheimera sp. KL1]